jgi:putative mRNA 3-end processing factor
MIPSKIPFVAWTSKGLYCHSGAFHIDPHRAVDLAIVTHAHSDHARRGSKHYICVKSGIDLLKTRLGKNINVTGYNYGETFFLGDVAVSLHPAGHILGSCQVRMQRGHEVWVASGDYKRDHDPSCEPFEVVKCDTFITEATFGTPKYQWVKNLKHGEMIYDWWMDNRMRGKNCILFGYSLGKAQRILAELHPLAPQPVLIHSTIVELTECYRREGRSLAATTRLEDKIKTLIFDQRLEGELILAPPSILKETWSIHLGKYETAFASGWMQGSGSGYNRGGYDKGFVMSDHADWNDLNKTIEESGARRVYVQHRNGALVHHLKRKGIEAFPVEELMPERFIEEAGYNLRLI